MVMHPAGGSIEHLLKISSTIIITHSIVILSIPFGLLGFWGLTHRLGINTILSIAAFITMSVGMIAVLCAAAINGLTLPLFLRHYDRATPELLNSIKPILTYNSSLNHAFDFIYMGAACLSILLWSILILKTSLLPKWLGWLGIVLSSIAVVSTIGGFDFVDLTGFRIFISGFIVWTVMVGFFLRNVMNEPA